MVSIRSTCLIVLALSRACWALTDEEEKAGAQTFLQHQVETQTYQADLTQTFHWSFPRKHTVTEGKLYYKAPDSLAMIYTKPTAETVLVLGDQLYLQRDKKSVTRHKLEWRKDGRPTQNVQFLLGFFQNGGTNYAKLFNSAVTRTNDELRVMLVPKNRAQLLRSVDSIIGWPSLDVQAMRIGLIGSSYINYEFSNPKRNEPIDASVFQIPKDP